MKNKTFISLLPLETERLIIRKTSLEDIDLLLKMDKQEATQKYLGGMKNKTREERIAFLEKKISKFDKGLAGQLTICLKDGTPIGFIGLSIDEEKEFGKIGYLLDSDYWNQGYCTEACKKLLEIGFDILHLKSITADTVEGNNSSKRVLEKLGFDYQNNFTKEDTIFCLYRKDNKLE